MNTKKFNFKSFIKRNSPLALSIIASAGVIATAIATAKATPKATELIKQDSREKHDGDPYASTKKEAFAASWKCYIPAAAFGASTVACIVIANALNKRQQAALVSAYALAQQSYSQYKGKIKELFGEEAHQAAMDAIRVEKSEEVNITSSTAWSNDSLSIYDSNEKETVRTFYLDSPIPGQERYFEATLAQVIEAEYHLNRNFLLNGVVTFNDFYEFLGLEKTKEADNFGWSSVDGDIYWIDFDHWVSKLDDGMEVIHIEYVFEPWTSAVDDI
jgi:hypothetical protein